ncbi:MAG: H-NS histone family protein [Sneathiella sp.]
MSQKELEKLLNDVKKALESVQARDRRNARRAAEKAAAEFGFSLNDLSEDQKPKKKLAKAAKKPRKPAKPKFANPADPKQTWTGKGRQPNWYRAQVDAGVSPSAMEI